MPTEIGIRELAEFRNMENPFNFQQLAVPGTAIDVQDFGGAYINGLWSLIHSRAIY